MYLDGLFVIIALVIGIANFVGKQNKKQTQMNRRYAPSMKKPQRRQTNIPEPLKRVMAEMEKSWNEGQNASSGDMPAPVNVYNESEGIEEEDRSRSGSLEYTEESQSSEGECDEHREHYEKKAGAKEAAVSNEPEVEQETMIFDLTQENLLRSIVMSEILGPPRALKKRIR